MNIPDKAIDKAQEFAYRRLDIKVTAAEVQKILAVAAPFIAAQALRDAARVDFLEGYSENARLYREDVAADLRNRADELDQH